MSGRAAWWICGSPYQRLRRDSLRLVRGSLEGDRFEQRTTGRLALPKGTDLRRVSMCSHDGDLHVFVAAAWLKASTARVHRPSRTWTSRCDRYCSGFSEFIRPWRGSRAAEWVLALRRRARRPRHQGSGPSSFENVPVGPSASISARRTGSWAACSTVRPRK